MSLRAISLKFLHMSFQFITCLCASSSFRRPFESQQASCISFDTHTSKRGPCFSARFSASLRTG
jgi:hypothetical protein